MVEKTLLRIWGSDMLEVVGVSCKPHAFVTMKELMASSGKRREREIALWDLIEFYFGWSSFWWYHKFSNNVWGELTLIAGAPSGWCSGE